MRPDPENMPASPVIRTALAILALCLCAAATPASAARDEEASKRCVRCHDEEDLPDWRLSAHAVTADERTPTCVTCHGPSPNHVQRPAGAARRSAPDRVFAKDHGLTPPERSEVCLSCHDKDPQRALWPVSAHPAADVACTSCHRVHTSHDRALEKSTQVEVCFVCHKEQRVQMRRPSHHPIPEGEMTCSDCHAVHGSFGPKLVKRDSTNDTCYTCHAEKRGPFAHPHEPVVEDCSTCHNPHGSTVPSLLVSRPPLLCQECHTPHVAGNVGALGGQPGVFTPPAPGVAPRVTATSNGKNVVSIWQGRSCLNCHTQVHGSNNPSVTNPTPQFQFR